MNFLIDLVRGRSLEFPDEIADVDRWNDADGKMHVSLDTADFMNKRAGPVDDLAADVMVDDGLDIRGQERGAVFGVPCDVQVDFAVIVAGHVGCLRGRSGSSRTAQEKEIRETFADAPAFVGRMEKALDSPHDSVWEEARDYVLTRLGTSRLGKDVWQAFIAWGGEIQNSEIPVDERRAIRAAFARLAGADDLPRRIRVFKSRTQTHDTNAEKLNQSVMSLHVFYPNDDIAFLVLADGFRSRDTPRKDDNRVQNPLYFASLILVFGVFVQRGMRVLSLRLAGRALGLRDSSIFRAFERVSFDPYRYLLTLAIVFPLTSIFAWLTIEPFYVLTYQQIWTFLVAVLWNVVIGGVLVESVGNLLSVILIRLGYDPLRMILDDIAVLLISIPILLFFQNSWFSIAAGASVGLAPRFLEKAAHWRAAQHPTSLRELDRAPAENTR